MIKVYKQTWLGLRLVGWIDDEGNTYKNDRSPRGVLIHWMADSRGQVYTTYGGARSLIGWVDAEGTVYDEYATPYGSVTGGSGRNGVFATNFRFQPGLVFRIGKDGAVYGRGLFHTKFIGRVEGTSNLQRIGGLALVFFR